MPGLGPPAAPRHGFHGTENRPNGIKIREQCPKKSRIKMQEVGEGKLKTGKPPKKSIANKLAGKQ